VKRTQIYLSEEQHELLRRIAFEQHKSISQVIREMIDHLSGNSANLEASPVKAAPKKQSIGDEPKRKAPEHKVKQKAGETLPTEQLEEAKEITESLKHLVSEERYNQLATALEEYRKGLKKLSEYSQS